MVESDCQTAERWAGASLEFLGPASGQAILHDARSVEVPKLWEARKEAANSISSCNTQDMNESHIVLLGFHAHPVDL
jgi:hypothetical protein